MVLAENGIQAPELPAIIATVPTVESVAAIPTDGPDADPTPAYGSDTEVRLAATRRPAPPAAVAPASAVPSGSLALDPGWNVISLADAEEQTGRLVPILPDYPVVQVLLRQASGTGRPLLVVTQQQPGGDKIHTVEGPVEDVADLVAAQLSPEVGLKSSEPSRSPPDYVESAGSVRRTSRVLAVMGRMPVDSLNALAAGVVPQMRRTDGQTDWRTVKTRTPPSSVESGVRASTVRQSVCDRPRPSSDGASPPRSSSRSHSPPGSRRARTPPRPPHGAAPDRA